MRRGPLAYPLAEQQPPPGDGGQGNGDDDTEAARLAGAAGAGAQQVTGKRKSSYRGVRASAAYHARRKARRHNLRLMGRLAEPRTIFMSRFGKA
jgi:hypothetical protein